MQFQVKNRVIEEIEDNIKEVIILEKYDDREISSLKGCISKDLYCSKINQLTGALESPILYINDYVLT